MDFEIHVRRVRNLSFQALSYSPSVDVNALDLRVQCSINNELRSSDSGKRVAGKGKGKFDGTFLWRKDGGLLRWHVTTTEFRTLKSKQPTVKLYLFAIGTQVHSIGWFFMDLR
jgi:hypothetical protein